MSAAGRIGAAGLLLSLVHCSDSRGTLEVSVTGVTASLRYLSVNVLRPGQQAWPEKTVSGRLDRFLVRVYARRFGLGTS